MNKKDLRYLVRFQYLGFRYHGWARQPDVRTVQEMTEKTLRYVLDGKPFKFMAASRTDAMVSAEEACGELFLHDPPPSDFLERMNANLPQDIRWLSMDEVSSDFNIIQDVRSKEYRYFFSEGAKIHPFAAPFLTGIQYSLDLAAMEKAAGLFVGEHNFTAFSYRTSAEKRSRRTVTVSEIIENSSWTGSFFPEKSWCYRVMGSGFGRQQVRLMMGALLQVGRGQLNGKVISEALQGKTDLDYHVAPASGLFLWKVEYSH